MPLPVTVFNTPSGIPASWNILAKYNPHKLPLVAGFRTTVFPATKAGAILEADKFIG